MRKITQPLSKKKLQICIGPTIRIGRESWCLPYAGFFNNKNSKKKLPKYLLNLILNMLETALSGKGG